MATTTPHPAQRPASTRARRFLTAAIAAAGLLTAAYASTAAATASARTAVPD